MILDGWFWAGTLVCLANVVICLWMTARRTFPDDASVLSLAAVELFLVVYGIASALRQAGGEALNGPVWEFWGYEITALILPPVAFLWAVTDKTRWSNLVMGAAGLTVFVMLHRMQVIFHG